MPTIEQDITENNNTRDWWSTAIDWSQLGRVVNTNTSNTYTFNPSYCVTVDNDVVRYWIKEELKKFFDQITNEKLEVDVDALQEYINNFKVD